MSLPQTAFALGLALCCAATGIGAQNSTPGASSEATSNVDKAMPNETGRLQRKMVHLEMTLRSTLKKVKASSHRLKADLRSRLKKAKHTLSALEAKVEELRRKNGKVSDCTRRKLILGVAGGCCLECDCKSRLRVVTINETATYVLTLGGAGGGHGKRFHGFLPGGRGAVVRLSVVLASGTRLRVVVGCGGKTHHLSRNHTAGDGGSATIVADRSRGLLLAIAGAGGGGSNEASGLPGRASEVASDSWAYNCRTKDGTHGTPNISSLMQQHFPGPHGGLAWREVRSRVLYGLTGDDVGTGGSHQGYWGGGGGGGYNGGGGGLTLAGGGGSSFCNATAARSCALEGGANSNPSGFFGLEKLLCP